MFERGLDRYGRQEAIVIIKMQCEVLSRANYKVKVVVHQDFVSVAISDEKKTWRFSDPDSLVVMRQIDHLCKNLKTEQYS